MLPIEEHDAAVVADVFLARFNRDKATCRTVAQAVYLEVKGLPALPFDPGSLQGSPFNAFHHEVLAGLVSGYFARDGKENAARGAALACRLLFAAVAQDKAPIETVDDVELDDEEHTKELAKPTAKPVKKPAQSDRNTPAPAKPVEAGSLWGQTVQVAKAPPVTVRRRKTG